MVNTSNGVEVTVLKSPIEIQYLKRANCDNKPRELPRRSAWKFKIICALPRLHVTDGYLSLLCHKGALKIEFIPTASQLETEACNL